MSATPIILASASQRRRDLLEQLGLFVTILDTDINESQLRAETAEAYAVRMAREKMIVARNLCDTEPAILITADTIVVCDNRVIHKPRTKDDALDALLCLSNREHSVFSAVMITDGEKTEQVLVESKVTFSVISVSDAVAYWRSGEAIGKAGGYAIQGKGAIFISNITGSYSGVMGLPLYETALMLKKFDIDCMTDMK
ncbi:Maf family nucleotide pyrophosphatase [Gammaproteobacteria bacterium]|nr:Maf family nucleotide pyrophosphatase [Gammaproteobacteria bacterium]